MLTHFDGTAFEDVVGSEFGDKIDGNHRNNILLGLAGEDEISGKHGHDILTGGDDDDQLDGDKGVDLLIGGFGADEIDGGSDGGSDGGGDLLIGGVTIYDEDIASLAKIGHQWNSLDPYDDRVQNLITGGGSLAGTGIKLEAGATVFDDQSRDEMKGNNQSRDLFFADLDKSDNDDDKIKGDKDDLVIDLGELLF